MYKPHAIKNAETKTIRASAEADEPTKRKRSGSAAITKYRYWRMEADLLLPKAALKLIAATRAGHRRPAIGFEENRRTCRVSTQTTSARRITKRRGGRMDVCM
jgi:hypothetical protein